MSPGAFNVSTDSTGSVSQSVSIHLPSSSMTNAPANKQTTSGPPPLIAVSGPSTLPDPPSSDATFVTPSSSVVFPPPLVSTCQISTHFTASFLLATFEFVGVAVGV